MSAVRRSCRWPDGAPLLGINARWRLYRYYPGAVYRPHVDGAWPGSGVVKDGEAEGGEAYAYDAFGDRRSRLTMVVYLNEGFEGGGTTFFTAAAGELGVVEARTVAPRVGAVLVFPHGEGVGSLVHEGSALLSGAKYILRTDVLYGLRPDADRLARPAAAPDRAPDTDAPPVEQGTSSSYGRPTKHQFFDISGGSLVG